MTLKEMLEGIRYCFVVPRQLHLGLCSLSNVYTGRERMWRSLCCAFVSPFRDKADIPLSVRSLRYVVCHVSNIQVCVTYISDGVILSLYKGSSCWTHRIWRLLLTFTNSSQYEDRCPGSLSLSLFKIVHAHTQTL